MGELWRDLTDLLGKRPVLWLPVLVADALSFFLKLGRAEIVRTLVLSHTQYHSVLGGTTIRTPMTAGAMESTSIVALLLSWGVDLLRILLYGSALVVTFAAARGMLSRSDHPWSEIRPALRKAGGGIAELALRALAVYALAALLVGYLNKSLSKSGRINPLHLFWTDQGVAVLVIAVLALVVAPAAVRVLAQRQPGATIAGQAQWLAWMTGVASLALGTFVDLKLLALLHASAGVAVPLELAGSLMVALPFAPMFAGLSLLARKAVREGAIVSDEGEAA